MKPEDSEVYRLFATIMQWADEFRKLGIRTNADTPKQAEQAFQLGAEGIGTNDLTQTTLGMSRDDSGSFLPDYISNNILQKNPFASIDVSGVGLIMDIAVSKARNTRPDVKLGICGEHGGDPDSIKFCHRLGLAYVSCAPNRIPIAKLAAAQAALQP